MKFDPTKPVQTRDGRPARIVFTDAARNLYPIGALVMDSSGKECVFSYTCDGRLILHGGHPFDLINIPQKYTVWMNFYERPEQAYGHATREEADAKAMSYRIACKQIEYTEGEGL